MGIKVLKSGLLTTIQDIGRKGYRKDGIIVSGAMDIIALNIGNLLVGNEATEAGLECTIVGPTLLFDTAQLIAITGGNLSPELDGKPIAMWRPVLIPQGSILRFGAAIKGCRTYITVFGGFDIPKILGSYATYLKAGFGGKEGRALRKNDTIAFNKTYPKRIQQPPKWFIAPSIYSDWNNPEIRVIKGPEYDLFTAQSKVFITNNQFIVTAASDRMGYRLQGPPLTLERKQEMLSAAVTFGTVQVPPNGAPILLMADHQTTGGYPRILQVITADCSKLAQMQPGAAIQFKIISLEEAQAIFRDKSRELKQLEQAIQLKYEYHE